MIFTPEYSDSEVSSVPNCICGNSGRGRDENACRRRHTCVGCGFDRDEHQRRLLILRREGLKEVGFNQHSDLLKKYGVNGDLKLLSLRVGKR